MQLSKYQFAKQFFIKTNQKVPEYFNNGYKLTLKNKSTLYTHPKLEVTELKNHKVHIICLGQIINPYTPTESNQDILNNMLNDADDFNAFEKFIYSLGGRWCIIILTASGERIYHDAAGLKPVFFSKKPLELCIGSQPALLEKLGICSKKTEMFNDFQKYRNSKSWPIGIVPYNDIKQLLPNHYLDLITLETIRYWPKNKKVTKDDDSTVDKLSKILKGTIKALTYRRNCTMSLTGGYDSRMLFSCAIEYAPSINFFTTVSNFTPTYDQLTPKIISEKYNLSHQFTEKKTNIDEEAIIGIVTENVGNMYYDRSMKNLFAFSYAIGENIHLPGSISEIARCFYYPYGKKILPHTGKRLAKYTGFKHNPYAEKGLGEWLQNLPSHLSYDILDLLYWEQRLGVWASCGLTYRESVIDQIPPMNNREYMELTLTVNVKDRLPPHNLIQKIINKNAPELLKIDFNGSKPNWLYKTFPKVKYIRDTIIKKLKI